MDAAGVWISSNHRSPFASAEQRLKKLGIKLPRPSEPFGNYFPDAASELLQNIFGKDKNPCRLVCGVASRPLGAPVELELIFEVAA